MKTYKINNKNLNKELKKTFGKNATIEDKKYLNIHNSMRAGKTLIQEFTQYERNIDFGKDDLVDSMIYAIRIAPNECENSPVEKHRPIIYQLYDYLKKNAIGYENRIKSGTLMEYFNISSNEILRSYIQEIRQSDILQKIVCSQAGVNGGYWIATNEEEIKDTLSHLYNRSMEMLKTYSIIKRKAHLDGQYRIKMSEYEREVIESILKGVK